MNKHKTPLRNIQKGIILVTVMLFLVIGIMLSLSMMHKSGLDQKILSNYRDHDIAFQSAEASLKSVEQIVQAATYTQSNFTTTCTNGLCLPNNTTPVWTVSGATDMWTTKAQSLSTLTSILGLSNAPQYLIEWLPITGNANSNSTMDDCYCTPSTGGQRFRISVRSDGATANSMVLLQSIYQK